jgi:hypothetical protein
MAATMAPSLGGSEGGDDPFRPVRDQHRDPVALPDANSEQRGAEFPEPIARARVEPHPTPGACLRRGLPLLRQSELKGGTLR